LDHLGNMAALDGRLDNYEEVANALGVAAAERSDALLVLDSFERWGQDCFGRLIGDWAIALWCERDRTLYLARDHAGSRTLFYQSTAGKILWSSYLETFCTEGSPLELDEAYLARILTCEAVDELTPYKGIRSVPPAHFIGITDGRISIRPHWNWVADSEIVYGTDAEYDEHFLHLFGQAINRRNGPGAKVLAELSGGMDSSSIVCMADYLAGSRSGSADRLDTISYYDDTERDWDDRQYFEAVEQYRKKKGIHVDLSAGVPKYEPMILMNRLYPYVCGDCSHLETSSHFERAVAPGGYRVVLSGIGGDELLGGVPTPLPELADQLMSGRLSSIAASARSWCLATRQPLLHTLYQTVLFIGGLYRPCRATRDSLPPWLTPELMYVCLQERQTDRNMIMPLSLRPSAIANGRAWWGILDGLSQRHPDLMGCYEYRYPYLDRELVEFLHRVPREKLVRPGRRRALMRRALTGILPTEVLERKRKAHVSRGPIASLLEARHTIDRLLIEPEVARLGLVDSVLFREAFHRQLGGDLTWFGQIAATINVELWLLGRRRPGSTYRHHWQYPARPTNFVPLVGGQ
jgi:asparagine synthase (glutamine-hydrolysing)